MAERRLFKEFKQLQKTPPSTSNPQVLELGPRDAEESIFRWHAVIAKPTKTESVYYYNGQWSLDIEADSTYPIKPPKISFSRQTPINHPNINIDTGEICLDILKSDAWSPAWNLESLVGAILVLIDEPEPDSPLNVDLANLFRKDKVGFESMVQYTMWKHSTLYDGAKESSGVKTSAIIGYDVSSEEEDEEDLYESNAESSASQAGGSGDDDGSDGEQTEQTSQEALIEKASTLTFNDTHHASMDQEGASEHLTKKLEDHENSVEEPEILLTSREEDGELSYIYAVGRQVTQEFLKKATEVECTSPDNLSKTPSSLQLAAVHQHVSKNVAKQIAQLCLEYVQEPRSAEIEALASEPGLEKVRQSLLEQIEQQVDEIQRHQVLSSKVT